MHVLHVMFVADNTLYCCRLVKVMFSCGYSYAASCCGLSGIQEVVIQLEAEASNKPFQFSPLVARFFHVWYGRPWET